MQAQCSCGAMLGVGVDVSEHSSRLSMLYLLGPVAGQQSAHAVWFGALQTLVGVLVASVAGALSHSALCSARAGAE